MREMGKSVEKLGMPLVVRMVSAVALTPGVMEPKLALPAFEMVACSIREDQETRHWRVGTLVRSQVTGKENDPPCSIVPFGRVELFTLKNPLPVTAPTTDVMGMLAVQLTPLVNLLPRARFPKSTGLVQFKGSATGAPKQYRLACASVT